MPRINYSIKYRKNEGLVLSPEELLTLYFYGITIKSRDGSELSRDTIRFHIRSAQQEIEKYLEIRLETKLIEQTVDYMRHDYMKLFPVLKTKLPVKKPLSLIGFLNSIEQIRYPQEWLNSKKDSEGHYYKKLHIVPTGSTVGNSSSVILSGITAYYGMSANNDIPNYFTVQYLTGFDNMNLPLDIIDLVGKYAAIKLFNLAGDLVLGAGIASMSLGLDGISQSINTTSSAENSAYSARIKMYLQDIKDTLARLKQFYKPINFTVL
jgi:hypothetical protein